MSSRRLMRQRELTFDQYLQSIKVSSKSVYTPRGFQKVFHELLGVSSETLTPTQKRKLAKFHRTQLYRRRYLHEVKEINIRIK